MKNIGRLFPDKTGLDLKGMTPAQRKVLYYNILFPGMGFVYAGDFLRSLLLGGGALGFLFLGFGLIWKAARSGTLQFNTFVSTMAVPGICFIFMLLFHLLSILKSSSAKISRCSVPRAILYTAASMALATLGMIFLLLTLWQSVPWQ